MKNEFGPISLKCIVATLCLTLFPMASVAQDLTSKFAKDVATHVLLHELGHAIFREFGVPILSNEEAQADAFATFYITQYLRDDAPDIIVSRARSWLLEDSEVAPENYDHKGEHPFDTAPRLSNVMPVLWGRSAGIRQACEVRPIFGI